MVKNSNDRIPLTQSPSITQETKARFNELLNAALSREASAEPEVFKITSGSIPNVNKRQSDGVPKIVPRQKQWVKPDDVDRCVEKRGNNNIGSSEESSGSRIVKRQVIAEIHSSQKQLVISSSEDDILSEKKEKRKKKKSRWKQVTESAQLIKEGQENLSFHMDEDVVERSSSRLSSKSYVVETPTFPVENIKMLTMKTQSQENSSLQEQRTNDGSPSRLSSSSYTIESPFPGEQVKIKSQQSSSVKENKINNISPSRVSNSSYTVEIPTLPVESDSKSDSILSKTKTPIPLPRKKSLKSLHVTDDDCPEKTPQKVVNRNSIEINNKCTDTVITIHDSASQGTEDDLDLSRSSSTGKLPRSGFQNSEVEEDMLTVRKQKRKKKRRKNSKSREEIELQEIGVKKGSVVSLKEKLSPSTVQGDVKKSSKEKPTLSGEQIVGVTIHGVDCPIVDPLVRHPVVRLYIIDTSTGEYYKKSDQNRSVCYYEDSTSYVQPIMTHPFNFKQHRSVTPMWQECLLLNESFSHLLTTSTLMLFEVCDFVSAPVASARFHTLGGAAGWHVVAWAFLRPVATNGTLNVTTRLRLQLYKPGKQPKILRPLSPTLYEWWGTAVRHKYSGCLYVTVTAVDLPSTPVSPRLRSRLALQPEEGSVASVKSASSAGSDLNSDDNTREHQEDKKTETIVWSRLAAQSCKLPNYRLCSLPVDGSMCVQFSDNGLWLACAKQDIHIYSVPQFQVSASLTGHQGLVYSLRWSADSKMLLSASGDCTICIWRPHRKAPLLQVLAHPSFVYCAQFVPTPGFCTVVSGCCDAIVRLWQGETQSSYQLIQELSGHAGFVSSVCVTVDGTRVISADSEGSLRIYDVEDGSLSGGRELRVREVRGVTISNVVTHPGGHRLLVHSRDSMIRSVDIATGAVIQTFKGYTNDRVQTGICVSACGSLVFACGEDGTVVAWDGHTGVLRAVYCGLLPLGSATLHYHPHEHMLVLASLSQAPVYILKFEQYASGKEIGLSVVRNEVLGADVIEKLKSTQNSSKWQKTMSKIASNSSQNSVLVHDQTGGKERKKKNAEQMHKEIGEKQTQSTYWPSLLQLECYTDKSSGDKDQRLLEIIRKMDNIILAAKQSNASNGL